MATCYAKVIICLTPGLGNLQLTGLITLAYQPAVGSSTVACRQKGVIHLSLLAVLGTLLICACSSIPSPPFPSPLLMQHLSYSACADNLYLPAEEIQKSDNVSLPRVFRQALWGLCEVSGRLCKVLGGLCGVSNWLCQPSH